MMGFQIGEIGIIGGNIKSPLTVATIVTIMYLLIFTIIALFTDLEQHYTAFILAIVIWVTSMVTIYMFKNTTIEDVKKQLGIQGRQEVANQIFDTSLTPQAKPSQTVPTATAKPYNPYGTPNG